jgi:DNA-binding transcriptional LysR family regulator
MKQSFTISGYWLDGVEAFVRVAERKSFRAAAVDLGISASALSQKIRALETRTGVPLLTRTTRKVGLTEAGQLFLNRAKPAFIELSAAYDDARNLMQPAGLLRLHVPHSIIPSLIEPMLAGFCAAYPKIELEIFAEDHTTDLIESGFDAGVQQSELLDADMITLRLMQPFRYVVAGAPDYFERHGRPLRLSDLRDHNCIRQRLHKDALMNWNFVERGRSLEVFVKGQVIVNDYGLNVAAAVRGAGLAYVSEPSVADLVHTGSLETVLTDFAPTSAGVFLHYPNRVQILPKLRCFIDYVAAHYF